MRGVVGAKGLMLWAIWALVVSACGKGSEFSNKVDSPAQPEEKTLTAPEPAKPHQPIEGFRAPELKGRKLEYITDGSKPLVPEPSGPVHSSVTVPTNGTQTKGNEFQGEIEKPGPQLSCPEGVNYGGECYRGVSIFRWKFGPENDPQYILSSQDQQCDSKKSAVCSLLKSSSFQFDSKVFSMVEPKVESAKAWENLTSLTICHEAHKTAGSERVIANNQACSSEKEVIAGLKSEVTGRTVPAYLWKRSSYVIISLDNKTSPAPGFVLSSATPVFHVLP